MKMFNIIYVSSNSISIFDGQIVTMKKMENLVMFFFYTLPDL